MENILNNNDIFKIFQRIERLTEGSQKKWGKMNISQMMEHLIFSLRAAQGEVETVFRPGLFSLPFVKYLGSQIVPWWHGAPTAPEFIKNLETTKSFKEQKNDLVDQLYKIRDYLQKIRYFPQESIPVHPVFGKLSVDEWSRLMWRHVDHHLRQFGV